MILTITDISQESARVSTFRFSSDTPTSYRAGQHISMRLPHENPDNRGTIRSFSISSSPTEQHLSITTNQGVSSFKKKLFSLSVGDAIEARGPGGGFIFREEDPGHHIMIAGGIGITPFRSMLKYVSDSKLTMPITLLYSSRTPEEILFKNFLGSIITNTIAIVYTITRASWAGRRGRIDEKMISAYCRGTDRYYVCGPIVFVEAMIALLGTMGMPSDRIHYEKFTGYN